MKISIAGAAVSAVLVMCGAPATNALEGVVESSADFEVAGDWVINEELSEDPREQMRRGGRGSGSGAAGARGGARGGRQGGFGGGSRGSGGRDDAERNGGSAGGVMGGAQKLVIQADEEWVSIRVDDRPAVEQVVDGMPRERAGRRGEVTTTAEWKRSQKLVIDTDNERAQIRQVYKVEDGRLLVETRVQREGRQALSFKRVYDRAGGEAPTESPD